VINIGRGTIFSGYKIFQRTSQRTDTVPELNLSALFKPWGVELLQKYLPFVVDF